MAHAMGTHHITIYSPENPLLPAQNQLQLPASSPPQASKWRTLRAREEEKRPYATVPAAPSDSKAQPLSSSRQICVPPILLEPKPKLHLALFDPDATHQLDRESAHQRYMNTFRSIWSSCKDSKHCQKNTERMLDALPAQVELSQSVAARWMSQAKTDLESASSLISQFKNRALQAQAHKALYLLFSGMALRVPGIAQDDVERFLAMLPICIGNLRDDPSLERVDTEHISKPAHTVTAVGVLILSFSALSSSLVDKKKTESIVFFILLACFLVFRSFLYCKANRQIRATPPKTQVGDFLETFHHRFLSHQDSLDLFEEKEKARGFLASLKANVEKGSMVFPLLQWEIPQGGVFLPSERYQVERSVVRALWQEGVLLFAPLREDRSGITWGILPTSKTWECIDRCLSLPCEKETALRMFPPALSKTGLDLEDPTLPPMILDTPAVVSWDTGLSWNGFAGETESAKYKEANTCIHAWIKKGLLDPAPFSAADPKPPLYVARYAEKDDLPALFRAWVDGMGISDRNRGVPTVFPRHLAACHLSLT